MTVPGDASEVGSIVAYLAMRRDDWTRGVHDTERDADRLGRLNPDIRISSNAAQVLAQLAAVQAAERGVGKDANDAKPFVINLWAALAAVAPAAVPIAGVLSGAMVGAIPLIATLALGLSGIKDELKSGQLEGTAYGKDLADLGDEVNKLKTVSANGILSGLHRGLQESHGLFGEVNSDIGTMSGQVGDIIAGGMPALLRILTQLNPLFVTFGTLVTHGADSLEHWSETSHGVEHFVAYVQTELPVVLTFLGNLVTLFSHVAQAAAPFGGVMLGEFSLFIHLLNEIPIGVLKDTIPVVIALYAAFKTYGAVTAVIAGVNNAINSMKAPFTSTAAVAAAESASVVASANSIALAVADEAAAVADAKAAEARAAAAAAAAMVEPSDGMISMFEAEAVVATGAAREITEAWQGMTSLFANDATVIAEASDAEAASFEAAALAATLAAEEIAAAATLAADTVAAEGETAGIGFTAALGPLAAVGIGLALLTTAFSDDSAQAQHNQEIMNNYAATLKENANALADVNIQQTAKNLKDEGAIGLADKLRASNTGVALGYDDLTLAVNGTDAQYQSVMKSLKDVADANMHYKHGSDTVKLWNDTGHAALDLSGKLKQLRSDFTGEMKVQAELAQIQKESQDAINGGATATAAQARALGVTSDAYLTAQVAAKKNTDQTNQQAIAFQLANDGGSLLALTLDKLSGKKLSYNQALNAFQTQLTTGGPKGTAGTPGTGNQNAVAAATSRHAIAVEALAVAQGKYDAAVAKGTPTASAHLALDRAKAALDRANRALSAAQTSGGGTPGTAADTRLRGMSAAAVQNRSDILGLVQAAQQAAEAYGKLTGSGEAGRQKLIQLRKQLIDSRVALHENRAEVTKYVDGLLTIPAKVPPTKLEVDKAAADKKIAVLKKQISDIKQGKIPGVEVYTADGQAMIKRLQAQIDALHGKTVPVIVRSAHEAVTNASGQVIGPGFAHGGTAVKRAADGTTVTGPGSSKSDSVPYMLSVGEEVIQEPFASMYRPLLKAANAGRLRLPSPGVGGRAAGPGAGSRRGSVTSDGRSVRIDKFEQHFHYPEPEEPSRTTSRSMEMAAYALSDF